MIVLTLLEWLLIVPGLVTALHLGLLTAAALAFREREPEGPVPPVRFLVLIPAHDEEAVIGTALDALHQACREVDRVLVVADRCTDRTAEIARAAGADLLERRPDQTPGRAAARQDGLEHVMGMSWDALVMIDADSVVNPGFLDACERQLACGADALQARSEAATGSGLIAQAYVAAFALQGVTVPRGRDRLGLSVRLRGTGMVLRRPLVERARFRSAASEDLFYSLDLCLQGIYPRHVESARLRSANVGTWRAASDQRVRYETGRVLAAREFVPALLRARTVASLEAAVHLLTPPVALAVLLLLVGTGMSALVGALLPTLVGVAALLVLVMSVCTALLLADAPARTWLALLATPGYLLWKLPVQVRALRLSRRDVQFAATPRT